MFSITGYQIIISYNVLIQYSTDQITIEKKFTRLKKRPKSAVKLKI